MADLVAPFAAPSGCPSLAVRNSLMPLLSPEARRARAMARIEKAVLSARESSEPASGPRSNVGVLDAGADDEPPGMPEIPRPPRAPGDFASDNESRVLSSAAAMGLVVAILAAGIALGFVLAALLHL